MKQVPLNLSIKDYNYQLPPDQVAELPMPARDESRLLIYKNGQISTECFRALPASIYPDATLVLNNTRVLEARILFEKSTGGVIEIFCLEPFGENMGSTLRREANTSWRCFIGGVSKWKTGQILEKGLMIDGQTVTLFAAYAGKETDSFIIDFSWSPTDYSFAEIIHAAGSVPLPPYIKRKPLEIDDDRYQTIFAKHQGSVAAPTAALHFTEQVFADLKSKNIEPVFLTLHVGAGTFKPVKAETIDEHQMHSEQFQISIDALQKIKKSNDLIAVGTTSLRTLESLYWIGIKLQNNIANPFHLNQWEAYELNASLSYQESIENIINYLEQKNEKEIFCETSLLIIPGYQFKSAKALVTNFHQPQSTLLLLVAAFIGEDWKRVYNYALENQFRFLSYGDSSLLWRNNIS